MNTFGLNKKGICTFGLGIGTIGWREVVRFTLKIRRLVQFSLEG